MNRATRQPEIASRLKTAETTASAEAVQELIGLLKGRGWQSAAQIIARRRGWKDRYIRKLAERSAFRIVSAPGGAGYCLLGETSGEELEHAGRSILSQVRKMKRKGIRFLREALARKPGGMISPS